MEHGKSPVLIYILVLANKKGEMGANEKRRSVFNYYYYSMRTMGCVSFWHLILNQSGIKNNGDLENAIVSRLKDLRQKRITAEDQLNKNFSGLAFAESQILESPSSADIQQCITTISAENNQVSNAINVQDKSLSVWGVIGGVIGIISESVEWVDKSDKSPSVQGIAQVVAEYSSEIQEPFRKPLADLAKFEGQKITSGNVGQIKKLTDFVLANVN